MNYAKLLKTCIHLTNTKLNVLSGVVGYDSSYLSRFSNGKLLPKGKAALKLCEDFGRFFAGQIQQQNLYKLASKQLNLELTEANIEKVLSTAFCEAYHQAKQTLPQELKGLAGSDVFDYLTLILEVMDIVHDTQAEELIYSLPTQFKQLFLNNMNGIQLKETDSSFHFLYIAGQCFYGCQFFEDFQKVLLARVTSNSTLREIELMLKL